MGFNKVKELKARINELEERNKSLGDLCNKYCVQAMGLEEKLKSYEPSSETLRFENVFARFKELEKKYDGLQNQYAAAEKCWSGYMAALMFNGIEDAEKASFLVKKELIDDAIANCKVTVNPDFDAGDYEIIAERVKKNAGETSSRETSAEVSQ